MTKTVITTRSINEELYELSSHLLDLPFERIRLTDTTAEGYFYQISQLDADWVINIDEDAFLIDPQRLLSLLEYMKQNNYTCCGVPDGGVIDIRFHNPLVPNAFFTIQNNAEIRKRFNLSNIETSKCLESFKHQTPKDLIKSRYFEYDEFEPYYKFFFWILTWGKILYLNASQWIRDGISTIARNHLDEPFLLHCWYGRDFDNQRARFSNAHKYCEELRAVKLKNH